MLSFMCENDFLTCHEVIENIYTSNIRTPFVYDNILIYVIVYV